ncbi:hypothetical protein K439DRAFT_1636219 [Ramaria rubella]|nr:hypothetical protein K439DRAFT_1636219 [Ramaria rubella]
MTLIQFWGHMVAHEVLLAMVCNGKCVWFLHREAEKTETLFISQPKPLKETEDEEENEPARCEPADSGST